MSRVQYQQGASQRGFVRQLPLVPVTARVVYGGLRLNGGSPAVGYAGWWQNLLHPKRAQSQTQAATIEQEQFAIAQAQMAQADAESRARFMWAAAAGAGLLAIGGGFYAWKKRRKNGRRRNR